MRSFRLCKSCCSLHQPARLCSTTLASTLSFSHGKEARTVFNIYMQKHTHTLACSPRDWSDVFMPLLDEEMLEALGSLESMLTTSFSVSLFLPFSLPQSLPLTRSLPSPVLSLIRRLTLSLSVCYSEN